MVTHSRASTVVKCTRAATASKIICARPAPCAHIYFGTVCLYCVYIFIWYRLIRDGGEIRESFLLRKWKNQNNEWSVLPYDRTEKRFLDSSNVFKKYWKKARENAEYLRMKEQHKLVVLTYYKKGDDG